MAETDTQPSKQSRREGHRDLCHVCIMGITFCALLSVQGMLPELYQKRLIQDSALGIDLGWLLPVAGFGLVISWFLRRQRMVIWKRVLFLLGAAQGGYWFWQATQKAEMAVSLIAAAWVGVVILQCYAATSQRAYQCLQWICLCLLIMGGWRQITPQYPQLLAISLVLLIFSSLAKRASPVGVAKIYVDSRFPGLDYTLLTGLFLVCTIGVVALPIYLYLPRPDEKQRQLIRGVLPWRSQGIEKLKTEKPVVAGRRGFLPVGPSRAFLSYPAPPKFTGESLFVVQGPRSTSWRCAVLDQYNGRSWRLRQCKTTQIYVLGGEQGSYSILHHSDGAWNSDPNPEHFQIHVLAGLGRNLIRPPGAIEASVPGRVLLRDGVGNVYTNPGLDPPLTYLVKTPPRRQKRHRLPEVDPVHLSLPEMPERLVMFVRDITKHCTTDEMKVQVFVSYLRNHCRYKLAAHNIPHEYDAVDHFLFESREGWCVHFAASLAVLCRLSGIPARVVTGFGPGSFDPLTRTMRIRDNDAHAWVEARPGGGDWQTFDPTPGSESPLAGVGVAPPEARGIVRLRNWLGRVAVWYERVYHEVYRRPQWLLVPAGLFVLLMWLRHRARNRDHRRHLRKLWQDVRGGTPRSSARAAYLLSAMHLEQCGYGQVRKTTPQEYFQRLRAEAHPAAAQLGQIIQAYEASAFGPQVTMRWNRSRLQENCEIVVAQVRRRRRFLRRRRSEEVREVIHGETFKAGR